MYITLQYNNDMHFNWEAFHSDRLSHMHIKTVSMELSILYFKGLPLKNSIKLCISVPEVCLYLTLMICCLCGI